MSAITEELKNASTAQMEHFGRSVVFIDSQLRERTIRAIAFGEQILTTRSRTTQGIERKVLRHFRLIIDPDSSQWSGLRLEDLFGDVQFKVDSLTYAATDKAKSIDTDIGVVNYEAQRVGPVSVTSPGYYGRT